MSYLHSPVDIQAQTIIKLVEKDDLDSFKKANSGNLTFLFLISQICEKFPSSHKILFHCIDQLGDLDEDDGFPFYENPLGLTLKYRRYDAALYLLRKGANWRKSSYRFYPEGLILTTEDFMKYVQFLSI